jgi:hypothetical protein
LRLSAGGRGGAALGLALQQGDKDVLGNAGIAQIDNLVRRQVAGEPILLDLGEDDILFHAGPDKFEYFRYPGRQASGYGWLVCSRGRRIGLLLGAATVNRLAGNPGCTEAEDSNASAHSKN